MKFLRTTVGLSCVSNAYTRKERTVQARVEIYKLPDNRVKLQAVHALNLRSLGPRFSRVVSACDYADRPTDPYNNIVELCWAAQLVHLMPAHMLDQDYAAGCEELGYDW